MWRTCRWRGWRLDTLVLVLVTACAIGGSGSEIMHVDSELYGLLQVK